MPLLDHFAEPLSLTRPWQMVHSSWANAIAAQLNTVLPVGYFAGAEVSWGREIEIDVATSREPLDQPHDSNGGTALFAPPRPSIVSSLGVPGQHVVEVRILRQAGGLVLVGAIEIVSPANNDRPAHREAFASTCAGYLRSGVSVAIVDPVTERGANLHADVMELLGVETTEGTAFDLYAVSYLVQRADEIPLLEGWPEELAIGAELPTLPLWIDADTAVPLDLEVSYLTACRSLRIDV